jgi:hypothetical protein
VTPNQAVALSSSSAPSRAVRCRLAKNAARSARLQRRAALAAEIERAGVTLPRQLRGRAPRHRIEVGARQARHRERRRQ